MKKNYMLAELLGGRPIYIIYYNEGDDFAPVLKEDCIKPLLFTDVKKVAYKAQKQYQNNY